jgi:hypothetical protein
MQMRRRSGRKGDFVTAACDLRVALLRNGYTPLPCDRETKRPVITGWPDITVTPELIDSWDIQFPAAQNHGLRLEGLASIFQTRKSATIWKEKPSTGSTAMAKCLYEPAQGLLRSMKRGEGSATGFRRIKWE